MSDATPTIESMFDNNDTAATLDDLQALIGAGNAERGFHEQGDRLRLHAKAYSEEFPESRYRFAEDNLRNYYITKLALIGTEVSEAIEELRNGNGADERYYSPDTDAFDSPLKPEGMPSELADIVIRSFDLAAEVGFSLGEVIAEKLAFNALRGHRHSGKAV